MNDCKSLKRVYRSLFLCVIAAFSALLCGCSDGKTEKTGLTGQYWESASYTLDEINAKFHPTLYNDEREIKDADVSDDALRAYNVMLGYAERILGQEYYVYDYYYADLAEPPFSWVIKVAPYEMAETAEAEERGLYFDEPLCLFYCEDGSEVNSTIEPYYMAQKWFADLERDMKESFPDYQIEDQITEFEAIYPNVLKERLDDKSDYSYLINESFYDRIAEWEYGNIIDVILPSNTKQSDAAMIFEQIKPILTRYCVTEVKIYTLTEDEDVVWEEKFTLDNTNE